MEACEFVDRYGSIEKAWKKCGVWGWMSWLITGHELVDDKAGKKAIDELTTRILQIWPSTPPKRLVFMRAARARN